MIKHGLVLAVSGMLLAGAAFGHAKLRSSSPPDEAHLRTAPKSLTLTFNVNVQLAVLTLTSSGKVIPLKFDRGTAAPQATVSLPPLADGRYQVDWSALSPDDGHVTKGTLSFIVGAAPAPSATIR